ncbi:unnamed protein product [Cylicocyclus nassatus]|uniref:UBC core domain-containing protein n=1 Tax=Cylicocyclus nassatus TaxID=53992 RepID=A0AA36M6H2_CYLNA|nr:unnamed protein product [Cylicocyclus nassatus]
MTTPNANETHEKETHEVSDNEDALLLELTALPLHRSSRRSGPWSSLHYEPNLKSMYRCCDYTRPLASKEDTVVYYKKGDVGLAHVHKVDRKRLNTALYNGSISCQTLELETIPSCRRIRRLVEEVFVVDRGFSVGETVIKYENEFAGNPEKEHMCMPQLETAIGQVVNVEVRGDVLVLPQKNLVVKNVPLGGNEYTEMVNYNSAHNYVMYKDWIGNACDCVNDVTLVYRGRYRFVVKEGGRSGVYLRRQDHGDDGKALVPGECVSISISEAIGRSATWEGAPPKTLTASRRRRGVGSVKCVIEKIETHSIIVDWITSPSSTRSPPKTIPKNELSKVTRIDPSANPRPSTCDRVKVVPDGLSTVCTFKEFFSDLTQQCADRFKKLIARDDEVLSTPCENCSKALQKDVKQNTTTAKAAKIARLSSSAEQVKEAEANSSQTPISSEAPMAQGDVAHTAEVASSDDSSDDNDVPSSCGKARVSACRTILRQKRIRKYPTRRRRCTPSLPVGCSRLAKDVLGDGFVGEVLLSNTLVDVQWMNGTIERQIPGYMLIPHDPDLDQQDHLPGVVVARKDSQNAESVFGLILSTNRAERSCVVSWFERTKDLVKDLGQEECLLFDIMPHPHYKRLFIGNYGVVLDQQHTSTDIRDVAFQVVADLTNGKQRIRFLNGQEEELWPFDILPIHFVDESLDSDSDDSSTISEEETQTEGDKDSVTMTAVTDVLHKFGITDEHKSKSEDLRRDEIDQAIIAMLKSSPEVEDLVQKCSEDLEACRAHTFFGVCVTLASEKIDKQKRVSCGSLIEFADVMTCLYRSSLLPDNFSLSQFSELVDDYENAKVFDAYVCAKGTTKQRSNHLASLTKARDLAKNHPELISIYHHLSVYLITRKDDGVRKPLRSKFYEILDVTTFEPRHLSWEYIQAIADDLLAVHEVCEEEEAGARKTKRKRRTSITASTSSAEVRQVTLCIKATARDLTRGTHQASLITTLLGQIMQLSKLDEGDAEPIMLYPNDGTVMESLAPEERIDETYKKARIYALASALVLLSRCKLIDYNSLTEDSIWKDLNCVFAEKYSPPSFVEYATLHEIINYVRSVDFYDSSLLKQLRLFTSMYSVDDISSQVEQEYSKKLKEISSSSDNVSESSAEKHPIVAAIKQKGTFTMLDECPDPQDHSESLANRKFYSTVFKEHKMLAQHVPDSIHVHAFANRLNVLHVIIMGPSGTPFDSTPFYFIFKLGSDYPEKPPEVTYVAYSQEQLNPNLYQNGKVCTSLLGTWSGQGVETWNPAKSNLLQVLLSIQALILVPEPYYNEAGYETRKQQTEMADRSKRYNETATINSLEYMLKIYKDPPSDFKELVKELVEKEYTGLRNRVKGWIDDSKPPLFPIMNSKGFKLALEKAIDRLDAAIKPKLDERPEEPMEVGDSNIELETEEAHHDPTEPIYEWSVPAQPRKMQKVPRSCPTQ